MKERERREAARIALESRRLRQEALDSYRDRSPAETPRDRLWTAVVVLGILTVVSGAVNLLLYLQVLESSQEGQENRAVSCQVLVALDVALDPDGPCFDPAVLRHYDPEAP